MPDFKTCSNGHNYDSIQYTVCPYCPVCNPDADYSKTMDDFKKTVLLDENGSTQFDKTVIIEVLKNENSISSPNVKIEKRKIVGWLVTFSHDELGQDYRLYAGKNKIGSVAGCDIVINDSSVSGDHATILFRDNEFFIKDNFSTNGILINGKRLEDGKLKDGDALELGNTSFTFKTLF